MNPGTTHLLMKFRKFDKILFCILPALVFLSYAFYYWSSRASSFESTKKLKNIFYSTEISDTITRIEPIYRDKCNTTFWIANYPVHQVVVNICKCPQLRTIEVGNVIQKDANSTECTFMGRNIKQTRINLQIEY